LELVELVGIGIGASLLGILQWNVWIWIFVLFAQWNEQQIVFSSIWNSSFS
jgi:hypothetical protein